MPFQSFKTYPTNNMTDWMREIEAMLNSQGTAVTADPTASTDNTQGYFPGSWIVNAANGRVWFCVSSATGAAVWALAVVPGTGIDPSNMLTQFGSAIGAGSTFLEEGNINRQVAATPGTTNGNAADTTDDVLFSFALPANSFDGIGNRGLCITANGKFAATGNNKRVKLWFNATIVANVVTAGSIIADTGALTSGNNNVGWELVANVFKYGAANSNTQYAQGSAMWGATHGGISLPVLPTATENAAITIAVTGASYTTGAAGDILGYWFEVNAMN